MKELLSSFSGSSGCLSESFCTWWLTIGYVHLSHFWKCLSQMFLVCFCHPFCIIKTSPWWNVFHRLSSKEHIRQDLSIEITAAWESLSRVWVGLVISAHKRYRASPSLLIGCRLSCVLLNKWRCISSDTLFFDAYHYWAAIVIRGQTISMVSEVLITHYLWKFLRMKTTMR